MTGAGVRDIWLLPDECTCFRYIACIFIIVAVNFPYPTYTSC